MTTTELATLYRRCYRTIQRERQLRMKVYRNDPARMGKELDEMNLLMADVEAMKEELKARLGADAAEAKQAALPGMPEARRREFA